MLIGIECCQKLKPELRQTLIKCCDYCQTENEIGTAYMFSGMLPKDDIIPLCQHCHKPLWRTKQQILDLTNFIHCFLKEG